jgi:glycerol uptake facilitator-like aquaporin
VLVAVGAGSIIAAARSGAFGHEGVALAFGLVVAMVVASSGHLGGAHINSAVTLDLAFAIEAGCTAILSFVIMGVATDRRVPGSVAPFALGLTAWLGTEGPIDG